MAWVYLKRRDDQLWTVGFFDAENHWYPHTDHSDQEEAAARVAWLNGGDHPRKPFPAEVI